MKQMVLDDDFTCAPGIWCIICPSYHGATLLSLILGNHRQVAALGDTLPFITFRQRCGCGAQVDECSFWRNLAVRIPSRGREHLFPSRPIFLDNQRMARFAAWPILAGAARARLQWNMGTFATAAKILVESACESKNASIFVDGFKDITRYLSLRVSGFRVKGAIHLVRDPRAFAASCKRVGIPVDEATRSWCRTHSRIRATRRLSGGHWVTLRYEDLVSAPEVQLKGLLKEMGLKWEPIIRPLEPGRHWIGNKSLRRFSGKIKNEEKWRSELNCKEIRAVNDIAGTIMRRYGY